MAQREVARPEVVDDDPDAELAQRLERGDRRGRRLEQRGLGDLEAEPRRPAGRPRRASSRRPSTKSGCWISRAETLTQRKSGPRSRPPATASRQASRRTQRPIGRIAPFSSAISMNSPGDTRPRSGCCQRTSASTPAGWPRRERRRSAGRRAAAGRARRRAGAATPSSCRSRIAACMPGSKIAKPALPLALAMYIATSALRTTSDALLAGVPSAGDADAGRDR